MYSRSVASIAKERHAGLLQALAGMYHVQAWPHDYTGHTVWYEALRDFIAYKLGQKMRSQVIYCHILCWRDS